jgi:hypothetical protein
MTEITGAAFSILMSHVAGSPAGTAIVKRSMSHGKTPGETALALISQGFGPGPQTEAMWKAQYTGSAELRAEFPSLQAYIALRRHEQGCG